MQRLKSLIRRTVGRRWLTLRARICLATGRLERARSLLREVITLSPSAFDAHLLMARVLMRMGLERDALQEFGVCYRLDPGALLRQPLGDFVRGRVLEEANRLREPDLFDLPPCTEAGPLPGEWDDLLGTDDDIEPPPPGTDFVDHAEYRRFRTLPAIAAEEVAAVDLDQLIVQLTQYPQPGGTFDQG